MIYFFGIEGNIGVGKSTMLKKLKETIGNYYSGIPIIYLQEPVEIWESITDNNNENIIEKFYKDNKKYSFSFQMMALISKLEYLNNILDKYHECIVISDRSVFTDKNIFAKMLYDTKDIEEINYKIYNRWFEHYTTKVKLTGIIYMHSEPETCYKRIKERNRKGEDIPMEYLKKCHEYHEKWLNDEKDILFIDATIDKKEKEDQYKENIKQITKFISNFIPDDSNYYRDITIQDLMSHPFM
tara:strand:+ start:3234 stop:3956 length:723 start_codon:yes stop_codon:yes gene_type:complete